MLRLLLHSLLGVLAFLALAPLAAAAALRGRRQDRRREADPNVIEGRGRIVG
jgi:hypothetical protein